LVRLEKAGRSEGSSKFFISSRIPHGALRQRKQKATRVGRPAGCTPTGSSWVGRRLEKGGPGDGGVPVQWEGVKGARRVIRPGCRREMAMQSGSTEVRKKTRGGGGIKRYLPSKGSGFGEVGKGRVRKARLTLHIDY